MFTKHLPEEKGLYLQPCPSIHTFFMKYPIDVIYLDRENVIVGLQEHLQPNKLGARFPNAASIIELPAGRIQTTRLQVGAAMTMLQSAQKESMPGVPR